MSRKPNCINPFEHKELDGENSNLDSTNSLPYIAPSVEQILENPGKILREIWVNIQEFVTTMVQLNKTITSSQYEKKILPRQLDSWNKLSETWKEKMMHFWPDWIHKNIKLIKENHTLHAILYALKTHKKWYEILGKISTMTGIFTYGALFWSDILSMKCYAIGIDEFHSWDIPTKATTQLWDRVLALAYEKIEKDQTGGYQNIVTAPDTTCPSKILSILLGKTFRKKDDMSDWKQWEDIWIFDYKNISKSNSFDQPIKKYIYIIKSYNSKTGIIRFCNAHNTKASMTIEREIFMNLPDLRIVYGNPQA